MKLQIFMKRLEVLLNLPDEEQDSLWAYKICQLTRFAVQRLLVSWPDSAEVQNLYDALYDLPKAVRSAKKAGPYADRLDKFADNMELRLDELHAYIEGIPLTANEPIDLIDNIHQESVPK